MGRLFVVLAACLLLAGCSPASTRAVRLTDSGMPQMVDLACESRMLTYMEIRGDNGDQVLDEKDPVYWRIEFPEPKQHYTVTVGKLPEGAVEKVPWRSPVGNELLDWDMGNGDAWEPGEQFTLDDLQGGKVRHRNETLTAAQFAKIQTNC
jgi:hypothetical protein